MEDELLGIGRVAALSGLTVSALRFYDGAGVLRPARVDPASGYRSYRSGQVRQARLVAHLRRVGLPLEDVRTVLADPPAAASLLAAHLDRLEAGLADARREISIVHRLLETKETDMTRCTVDAGDLARALREVRYAVSTDPDQPTLNGVFLDSEHGRLRAVATDRYRLAISSTLMKEDVELQVLLPTAAVDELLAGDHRGDVEIVLGNGSVTVAGSAGTVRAQVPDVDFPPYRSVLEFARREVPLDAVALRSVLEDPTTDSSTRQEHGRTYRLSRLSITGDDVTVGGSDDPDALVIGVNRDFLLDALQAGDQLVLGLDGPITPLAIRTRDQDGTLSVLMPVRLDEPASLS